MVYECGARRNLNGVRMGFMGAERGTERSALLAGVISSGDGGASQ